MPARLDRMIYVDDSGHPQSGLAVYGWIEFSPDRWRSVLRNWLDTRKLLWREFGIPITTELHTTDYANGRGRISKRIPERHIHDGREYWKDFGREVAHQCLETLRCTEGLTSARCTDGANCQQDEDVAESKKFVGTVTNEQVVDAIQAQHEATVRAKSTLAQMVSVARNRGISWTVIGEAGRDHEAIGAAKVCALDQGGPRSRRAQGRGAARTDGRRGRHPAGPGRKQRAEQLTAQ